MDIVERLRSRRVDVSEVDIAEAADLIDRLRAEVAHWKEARSMAIYAGDIIKEENDRLRAEVAHWKELIAWHAHQIALLPETDNVMVQHHREAMHCVERLRAEREQLAQMMIRQSLSTGHGDTVGDLVRELEPQIKRMRAEIVTLRNAAVNADERTDMLRGKLATAVLAHIDATAESDLLRVEVAALKKDAERNP